MPRPSVPLLSRDQIAIAALAQLDESGTLTLPKLASGLNVSVSSIYHHFAGGREEIIERIRGLLTGEWPSPLDEDLDWRDYAEQWAHGYRAAMARHPHVVPLLTLQTVSAPETLASYEALARVLRRAGFADEDLLHAVSVLDCFILGSALDASAPLDVWADSGDPGSALRAAIAVTRTQPGDRSLRSFELGLHALLAGLAELLRVSPPGPRGRRSSC
ncbi:TetR/AcrR family transcriptional regulator C-terminal domain-containing protein [Cryptosporangium aurantiacum]|uniref:Transcriptional regulator, TetR family n=1 Tax=Cryptosporangium aurantiacum TaxID=134849 RepID=A0A1M7RN41_9ACTN|nr:TetR/AcrR family transcriptional regulator C-terminal domain-containing protein [Cryptosporangium aurantiacum]SHN47518.1 transcriptional regulator, TetR family [Cryptosporangium aurantiacum]